MQISKGKEEGVTSMSIDDKYYDIIHLDGRELALLMKGLDMIMSNTEPFLNGLKWSHMEAHVLHEKLKEVKNA